jgi:L-ribulose-5-phosphate 3-epimerase
MRLAYNTNGLAHHNLLDAIELLAEIGYSGISITRDHNALNPFDPWLESQLELVSEALRAHNLQCVIETGARYLLDPRTKHEPTLVSRHASGRDRRIDFLCRAIDIAARLDARCVSVWSGVVRDGAGRTEVLSRLVDGTTRVLEYATERHVRLAFEPEPGMLIDTLERYNELLAAIDAQNVDTSALRLTMDIGHLHCLGETPIADKIRQQRNRLANVHIEDMRAGVHEHLMFGDGAIDFPPVIAALTEIGYDGLLSVELSRHSHEGPEAARRAYNFLKPLLEAAAARKEKS